MRSSCPGSIRLWPARRNQTLTMKPLRPQFPVILVIYCFCMLQIPSSGFPQPSADPPDGLDIVQLEQLAYCLSQWASISRQPKEKKLCDNQDIYKRFLFHYSRTQEATHPVKSEFPPVHPLMHLVAKLANRRMKRFLQRVCASIFPPWFYATHSSLNRGESVLSPWGSLSFSPQISISTLAGSAEQNC
nr:neuromedin-S [Chlorocebus sabaeus]